MTSSAHHSNLSSADKAERKLAMGHSVRRPSSWKQSSEMIALARTTFDANAQPGELIAWDHLDAEAFGDTVRLEICSWTGKTVFDDLRTVEYQIEPDGTASYIFDSSLLGDCLNTELIDTALAFTRDYDTYWASVLEDPTTFDPETDLKYSTPDRADAHVPLAATWANDGTHWEGSAYDGRLPESSLQSIAWRRYDRPELGTDVLELVSCRELGPTYGLYRGDLLIDDERGADGVGPHAVDQYLLTRVDQQWLNAGGQGLRWADCIAVDWQTGVSEWQPEPVPLELLP